MRGVDPRLSQRAREVRSALAGDVVLGCAAALLVIAQAALLARIAAEAFWGATLEALLPLLGLMLAVVTLRAGMTWVFDALGRITAQRVQSRLRMDVASARITGSPSALDGVAAAELASASVSGVDALEAVFARYLPQVVLAVVVPAAVLLFAAWTDPLSAGLMAVTLPLVPLFMWLVGRYSEERMRTRWRAHASLATQFVDTVRGLPTLRAYNRTGDMAARTAEAGDCYRRATMHTLRTAFLSGAVLDLAATLGVALVAVTVGVRLVDGSVGLRAGLTVLVLAPELYAPLRGLAAQYHSSIEGSTAASRLLDAAEQPPEVRSGVRRAPDPASGEILFDAVGMRYPSRPQAVLHMVDLIFNPGEILALTGPSGSGKSTLAALLLGLVEPSEGRILVGGVPLHECDLEHWRSSITWMPQAPSMLRLSVAGNIRLGDDTAGDARVREAAHLAAADGFISALPQGYETLLGEGARALSAGQRQRIALARTFLLGAPLMVLDEPTANLDPVTARHVATSIDRLRAGRTILLITHDAGLAAIADRVVRLDRGRAHEHVLTGAA